jgi:hypothetical protein
MMDQIRSDKPEGTAAYAHNAGAGTALGTTTASYTTSGDTPPLARPPLNPCHARTTAKFGTVLGQGLQQA